jgi:hypothetical protein
MRVSKYHIIIERYQQCFTEMVKFERKNNIFGNAAKIFGHTAFL